MEHVNNRQRILTAEITSSAEAGAYFRDCHLPSRSPHTTLSFILQTVPPETPTSERTLLIKMIIMPIAGNKEPLRWAFVFPFSLASFGSRAAVDNYPWKRSITPIWKARRSARREIKSLNQPVKYYINFVLLFIYIFLIRNPELYFISYLSYNKETSLSVNENNYLMPSKHVWQPGIIKLILKAEYKS